MLDEMDDKQIWMLKHMAICRNFDEFYDVVFQLEEPDESKRSSLVKGNSMILA